MKLLVVMASRGNPNGLMATISSLMGLATGKHDIVIKVGVDDDDAPSLAYTPTIQKVFPNVQFIIVERKPTLGAIVNELVAGETADVYIPMTDRMIALSPNWDEIIGHASLHFYKHVLWWQTEQGAIMPIIPKKFYEAYKQIFTEYFPFWFDDTWIAEVNSFVHGNCGYSLPVQLWRKPGCATKRMHDLRFWMDFFISKRSERIIQAQYVSDALGITTLSPQRLIEVTKELQSRDDFWAKDWRRQEKIFGDSVPRDETYYQAARAAGWDEKDILEARRNA